MSDWIPASERLPNGRVLVCRARGDEHHSVMSVLHTRAPDRDGHCEPYDIPVWWDGNTALPVTDTYWMPLPPAPARTPEEETAHQRIVAETRERRQKMWARVRAELSRADMAM